MNQTMQKAMHRVKTCALFDNCIACPTVKAPFLGLMYKSLKFLQKNTKQIHIFVFYSISIHHKPSNGVYKVSFDSYACIECNEL